MKIPSSELQNSGGNNHPQGDFSASVKACTGEMNSEGIYEIKVTFSTTIGTVTQFWNTDKTGWKIRIFGDALGLVGDFDTDDAIGKKLDLKVTKKVNTNNGKTYTNVETHAAGSLVLETNDEPPMATAANDVPF
jgi:hypothetical protein